MLNAVWLLLLLAGIVAAALNGNIEAVTQAALEASQNAILICLDLAGVMALWLGIMRIGEKAGLIKKLASLLSPVLCKLFPEIPKDHPAMGAVIMNLSANLLGLGNAATPFGLRAMQEMQALNRNGEVASNAMCTFLALNTSCITLIPATIIGVRLSFGSVDPTEIVGACIFATACAMVVALSLDYWFRKMGSRRKG